MPLPHEFANVFDNSQLHPMDGLSMDIQLQPGAEPSYVRNARAIFFAFRDQVKSRLDGMLDDGIIESVTECSVKVVPPYCSCAKEGNFRDVTDRRSPPAEQPGCKPTHPARTPHDAVAAIGKATYFTTLETRYNMRARVDSAQGVSKETRENGVFV